MSADTLPEHPSLEGPEWDERRPLTPEEEADAWKIAQLSASLMAPEGLDGWENWADAVRCGAAILEISRRYVVARERDPPSPDPSASPKPRLDP